MTEALTINNVGALAALSIPIPEGGGVVVLKGANGAGKSTALESVRALAGENIALEPRRPLERGTVEGFGVKLTVTAKRTTRVGELFATVIDGTSLETFVDPQIADADRADSARMVALCRMVSATSDLPTFAAAVGVDHWTASAKTVSASTLPDLAAGLRRDLQAAAREFETKAEFESGALGTALALSGGAGPDDVADVGAAQTALASATVEHARLVERAKGEALAASRAEQARQALEKAEAEHSGPPAAQAEAALRLVERAVADLEAQLAEARAELATAKAAHVRAVDHERTIATLRASIMAPVDTVTPEQVKAAADVVCAARATLEAAQALTQRVAARKKADKHAAAKDAATLEAKRLRDAAEKCDEVLQSMLARAMPAGLTIAEGRLVYAKGAKVERMGKLSHGERWKLGVDIALDAVPQIDGRVKLVVIAQEAWEGLDPENRAAIKAHALSRGCVLLAGEADSGDVRAEVL
jgi:energy-coupling factor transporter ATP-binding protein EcfA2